MQTHAPKNYKCPFCSIRSNENRKRLVYRNNDLTVFIASIRWPNNNGIVLIIPNKHYENIFDAPDAMIKKIAVMGKRVAQAILKGYDCDGVSTRQHNGPSGTQSVWHYHLQVIPRYRRDKLYELHNKNRAISKTDSRHYTNIMRKFLKFK